MLLIRKIIKKIYLKNLKFLGMGWYAFNNYDVSHNIPHKLLLDNCFNVISVDYIIYSF